VRVQVMADFLGKRVIPANQHRASAHDQCQVQGKTLWQPPNFDCREGPMAERKNKLFEIWTMHVKIGKQPWRNAYYRFWYGEGAAKEAAESEAYMNHNARRRKYKAVKYVPERKPR